MTSLRAMAPYVGVPVVSVLHDFFGYSSPPPWKMAPAGEQTHLPQALSVRTQVDRLRRHLRFSLDVVRVGTDETGLLPAVDEQNLDCAVQVAREVYAAIGVGISRLDRWFEIPLSDDTGYDVIDSDFEAWELVRGYDAGGRGIDAFFVLAFTNGNAGVTPWKRDGVVVESREEFFLRTARTLCHELGHLFGLGHENDDPTNLMCQSNRSGVVMPGSTNLYPSQIHVIHQWLILNGEYA